jgi:hypothetical protein
MALTKHAICLLLLPPFPRTCFNSMPRQIQAPCLQMSRTLQPALLMVHVFSITALVLKVAKVAHCTWPPITSMNHLWIGNRRCVGSCRSRLIGKCAQTMWKWPLFAGGHVPTGATTAPKWPGVARKGPTRMSVGHLSLTALAMSYPRLSALRSSCN